MWQSQHSLGTRRPGLRSKVFTTLELQKERAHSRSWKLARKPLETLGRKRNMVHNEVSEWECDYFYIFHEKGLVNFWKNSFIECQCPECKQSFINT